MDSESPSADSSKKCCSCGCTCSNKWDRIVKRKIEQIEEQPLCVRDLTDDSDLFTVAHVDIENECLALRETINTQQQTIHELYVELEEERNAACSAANEAMSMILRLQREKAEIQMEARQFKLFAEEKMAHDQEELLSVEELLDKKEQLIQSLNFEIESYQQNLISVGFNQLDFENAKYDEGSFAGQYKRSRSMGGMQESENSQEPEESDRYLYSEDTPLGRGRKPNPFEYPPLRCSSNELQESLVNDPLDLEKHASGDTPHNGKQVQDVEYRLHQLEGGPSSRFLDEEFINGGNSHVKVVSLLQRSNHSRTASTDSTTTYFPLVKEEEHEFTVENKTVQSLHRNSKTLEPPTGEDYCYLTNGVLPVSSTDLADDTVDRIYTIDFVHGAPNVRETFMDENGHWVGSPVSNKSKDADATCYIANGRTQLLTPDNDTFEVRKPTEYVTTPRGSLNNIDMGDVDVVQKLYQRLQALEADREQMKQAITSMQRDNVQVAFLREITQQLRKELTPDKKIVKKPSLGSISFMSILKWITSFIFHGRKTCPPKYQIGPSGNNVGLMLLLDRSPHFRQWRCITRAKA